jgi:diphthamide synthase (EF-2-diphthine--ammonia ligase)
MVFTEVAHKERGKCCGSGCRHCPYNHENVRDKAGKIQQPAILCKGDETSFFALSHGNVHVMFFSGGKDSFLTVRALAREASQKPFGLVLLTTFDATSRIIAHQEMGIDIAQRQAEHLGVTLVAVPMHRGSSETYVDRVRRGLDLIERVIKEKVSTLVFGDLHLEHIHQWRTENLSKLGSYKHLYPLWKKDYNDLVADLEKSHVDCVVTASSIATVQPGDKFDHKFRNMLSMEQVDVFGENGEFHTMAQVWSVDRETALGA